MVAAAEDMDDLEDMGGALSGDGVRVTRDLPPTVKLHVKPTVKRGGGGGGGGGVGGGGVDCGGDDGGATTTTTVPVDASHGMGAGATSNTDGVSSRPSPTSAAEDMTARADAKAANVPGTAKVHVKTFGCSHNISDSEFMAGQLAAYGRAWHILPAISSNHSEPSFLQLNGIL